MARPAHRRLTPRVRDAAAGAATALAETRLWPRYDLHQQPACPETPDVRRGHRDIGQEALQHPIETVLLGASRAARRTEDRYAAERPEKQQVARIDRHAEMIDRAARRFDRGRDDVAPVRDRRCPEDDQQILRWNELDAALEPGHPFVRDLDVGRDDRPGRDEAIGENAQRLGDDARLEARQDGRDDADAARPVGREPQRWQPQPPSVSIAASSTRPETAKGMIFTVPTISPSSTARKGGRVASVSRSSTALRRSTAPASTSRTPFPQAKMLARPVNARSILRPGPVTASARCRAASFSSTSPSSSLATTMVSTPERCRVSM